MLRLNKSQALFKFPFTFLIHTKIPKITDNMAVNREDIANTYKPNAVYPLYFLRTSMEFLPPKLNALHNTASKLPLRALLGT